MRQYGHPLVCHCLLLETEDSGLILVDSGFGLQDLINPAERYGVLFSSVWARPGRDPDLAAVNQIKRLGLNPSDVRHIILTHMDLDHVGGLADFPDAKVHVHETEYANAMSPDGFIARLRYHVATSLRPGNLAVYNSFPETWRGLSVTRPLPESREKIFLLPLPGHTNGHCAVVAECGGQWLAHAGDGYFGHMEVHGELRYCSPVMKIFQQINQCDRNMRLDGQELLHKLSRQPDVKVFCSHDPSEFANLKNNSN